MSGTVQPGIAATRRPELSRAALLLALPSFLYLLITWVLQPPSPIRPESLLDPSWRIVLTDAFLKGWQFGHDIIYTYGPWGFLEVAQGNPAVYPWLVFGRLLISVSFLLALASFAVRTLPQRSVPRHFFVAAVVLLCNPVSLLPVLPAAMLLVDDSEHSWPTPLLHLVAIVCGLTMWIKFSGLVLVGLLAGVLAVQDLIRRRWPVFSLEIGVSALGWWVLSRQTLSAMPAFLRGALSLTGSYSAEMFTDGPGLEIVVACILLVGICIPFGAYLLTPRASAHWPVVIWLCLFFASQLKEAFVRHDSFHVWMGIVNVLLPAALILFCATGAFDSVLLPSRIPVTLQKVCVATVLSLCLAFPLLELGSEAGRERLYVMRTSVDALGASLRGDSMSARYDRQLATFQRTRPLTKVPGTTTFFPDDAAIVYGNNLSVRLPPVPQAFAAYNEYLSGLNASFYRGTARPDFIFFDVSPIDQRYPTSSDSLSWLAFLDCYTPDGNSGTYLILRSDSCRSNPLKPIGEFTAQPDQTVTVPAADGYALWVQFDVHPNITGKIIAAIARPPLTRLRVRTAKGERTYRISPEAAHTGFLLSPLIEGPAAFERLYRDPVIDHRAQVRELSVLESGYGNMLFDPAIRFRFYSLAPPIVKLAPPGDSSSPTAHWTTGADQAGAE